MNKALNWGILSTGTIAHKFAKTIKAMGEEAVLYAASSRDLKKAEDFAEEYGIVKAYGSYEEMLLDENVDAVYVATPHSHHFDHMMLCLEHGKHVLCEKSFTVNRQQAELIFKTAKEKNLFVMEGFWTKFLPIYREVEKVLADGVLGDIRLVTAQYGYCTGTERGIRKFDPQLAGGTLLDIGVYAVGFASMILGYQPKAIETQVRFNDMGTDEFSSILLQYENGAIAQLTTAIQTTMPVLGCIYGSKGYMQINDFKSPSKFTVILNNGTEYDVKMDLEINGFEYEIREAQNCIMNNQLESSIQTPEQSIAVMDIMDQVRSKWGLVYPMEK